MLENGEIGKFIQVNDAACKRMGYSREEMLRKTPLELNSEKSRESVNPKIKNIIIEKHAIVEAEHVTKDGRIIPVEISTTVTQLNNKTIFLSIARDISERKLAEEKLRETNEYLSNLFNYANAPIIVWDTSLSITKFNPAFENLSGYIEEEVLGNKIDILFPEDKAVSSLEMISRTISGERWETVEIEIKRKDGDRRIVIWNSANILDKDGETVVETIAQGQDITKRKRAEEELKESENRFRQTFVLSPVGIVMVGLDKRFQRCNNSFSQSLGYKPEELIGKAIADVTFHEDIEIGIDEMMSILNEEIESTQIQKRYLRKDGNIVWGEVLISIVRDHKNQPQYFLAIIQDITERKLAVEYLIESERKLREAQKMAHLGFWSWEVKTGKVEWSDEVFKIFNLDPIKFTPQIDSIMSLSPWDGENQRDKELINRAMENHTPGEYEQKFLRPDMTIGYYYSTFQGKYKENGDLLTIVGTILDITERKKAEATLRESEDKFKYVFDHSVIGKSITLPSGEITVNRAFCEMTGYSEEELKSMNWREISHPDDIDMTEKELQSLISGKNSSVRFTKRYIHKNGSVVWADVGTALRRDIDGKPLYYMTAVGEITSLKNAEENILRLNQELEEKVILRTEQLSIANKELEAFSYSVSHDLRSPLRAVHSFTNILLEDYEKVLDDEGKRICRIITSSTVQMGGLIDDLLNFSRIGRSEVKLGMLDMKSLASSVIDELCGGKSKNRVNLKLGKLSNAYGDLNLIRIVWTNLISNAIKYSSTKPDSKIVISSTHEDHTITYSVKDNGVGFDMNYINKLFGVFQRLHSEKDFEGNGVGLAIVQRIINKHGGKVWAVGEVGKGATFSFSLPAEGSRQLANQKPDA